MSKVKNPQDKKKLSYSKDCRNAYGESDKGSRKSIRKNKKLNSKSERSANKELKQLSVNAIDDNLSQEVESSLRDKAAIKRRKGFKKYPDQPLETHIEQQQQKSNIRYGRKKNS